MCEPDEEELDWVSMDNIRVPKVHDVTLWQGGQQAKGTLHLTTHHLIFKFVLAIKGHESKHLVKPKTRELWITYPVISNCIYRLAPLSATPAAIYLRCRDFKFVSFHFLSDKVARDVYESIKALTCKLGSIEKLYAFNYKPTPHERKLNGWKIYDAKREFARQGISEKQACNWRISNINHDYSYSPTYPAVLVVPGLISDNTLNYAVKFRSRGRIPALTYLHPVNNCSITRCSQPLVGVRGNRSVQDEKLVLSIFATNTSRTPESSSTIGSSNSATPTGSVANLPSTNGDESFTTSIIDEDEVMEAASKPEKIYGSQQKNLIVDARPTVNAIANHAQGMGSESMENYKFASKVYLGIENIHAMRKSLDRIVDALKNTDIATFPPVRDQLESSNWVKHIAKILAGSAIISRQVGLYAAHVLIHCSDGWDRTSQLSAISQLCLDPYYRTLEGFIVLIEKDWVSFGHMFRQRSGFLSSEKWFETEGGRASPNRTPGDPAINGVGPNALENALAQATKFFSRKSDNKGGAGDKLGDDTPSLNTSPTAKRSSASLTKPVDSKVETKVSEVSPMFHQFLDATYQLLYQHPTRFEFNERFLKRLLYHLYSCQYGTFLYDSEKERVETRVAEKTRSVWDHFLSRREEFLNPNYDPQVDDRIKGRERLIFPDPEKTRWWAESFGRKDDEMNVAPVVVTPHPDNGVDAEDRNAEDRNAEDRNAEESSVSSPQIVEKPAEIPNIDGAANSPVPTPAKDPEDSPVIPFLSPSQSDYERVSSEVERYDLDQPAEDAPNRPDTDLDPLGNHPVTPREAAVSSMGLTDFTARMTGLKLGKSPSPASSPLSKEQSSPSSVDKGGDVTGGFEMR